MRRNRTIEAAPLVLPSANERANVAVPWIERDHRAFDRPTVPPRPVSRLLLDCRRTPPNGAIARPLRYEVQRGVDDVVGGRVGLLERARDGIDEGTHRVERIGVVRLRRAPLVLRD